jgi:hypothetical protein
MKLVTHVTGITCYNGVTAPPIANYRASAMDVPGI